MEHGNSFGCSTSFQIEIIKGKYSQRIQEEVHNRAKESKIKKTLSKEYAGDCHPR